MKGDADAAAAAAAAADDDDDDVDGNFVSSASYTSTPPLAIKYQPVAASPSFTKGFRVII